MRCAAGRGKAHSAINRLAPSPLPPRVNQEIRSGRNIARSDVAMCAFAWTDPPASRRAPGVESRNFKGRHTSDISPSPNPIRNGPNNLSGLLLSPATFGQRPLDMRPVARDRRRRRSAVFSSREREREREAAATRKRTTQRAQALWKITASVAQVVELHLFLFGEAQTSALVVVCQRLPGGGRSPVRVRTLVFACA